jgi:DNA-binding transcriptional LysR family regulator
MDHLLSIRAFVAVIKFQSFTTAAKHLEMSPATLSRAITSLESHTSTRLVNRSTRHVSLADDARAYFASCAEILERLDREELRLAEQRNTPKGVLRLAAHPLAVETGLSQLVDEYLLATPDIRVAVTTTDEPLRLEHGNYDAVIYPAFLVQDAAAICRPLVRSSSVLVATRAYLEASPPVPSSLDFTGHTFINTRASKWDSPECGSVKAAGIALPHNARLHAVMNECIAVQLALNSYGIALLPTRIAQRYMESGRLVRVLPGYELTDPMAELDIAFVHRRTLPRRVRDFVDHCVSFFRESEQPDRRVSPRSRKIVLTGLRDATTEDAAILEHASR